MSTKDLEVADLRARVAELEARVAEFAPAPKPALPRYEEPAVRLSYPAAKGDFEMASDTQLKRLLKIVFARFPHLMLKGDVTDRDKYIYFDGFKACFYRLGFMNRIDNKLDTSRTNGFWKGETEDWLRTYGGRFSSDVSLKNWIAAVVGHTDIRYATPDAFATMQGLGFGLIAIGDGVGRKPGNAWRKLLMGDRIREPV